MTNFVNYGMTFLTVLGVFILVNIIFFFLMWSQKKHSKQLFKEVTAWECLVCHKLMDDYTKLNHDCGVSK